MSNVIDEPLTSGLNDADAWVQELGVDVNALQQSIAKDDTQAGDDLGGQLSVKQEDATDTESPDTPGLGGMDTGQVQAQATQIGQKILGKAWDWITEKGETTIVIENLTSKVLRFEKKELVHPKESIFFEQPPTEIIAAKSPNDPTKVTMSVRTDKWVRGKTKADTSGFVVYVVVGTDTQRKFNDKTELVKAKVRAAWSRKGEGQFNEQGTWTDLGGYKFEVQQVMGGTITYRLSEEAPNPKPKDPQSPEDKKPKDPQTPTDTKAKSFEHTIGPFEVGQHDKLKSGSITKHAYDILNDKDKLDGKVPEGLKIVVHGYTSNTDTAERNFVLSKKRAEEVIKALKEVGIPAKAIAEPRPHGEWETTPMTDDKTQEKEDEDWRKVKVEVEVSQ